ncbi:GNAT family N-acetyltransferase [Roseovarius nanhaiticus]|uniref:GNAT family N-acetyltransferase n=1 Tax=Roseovarius nanhaiticus TaxID=573024 RepID=UPI00248F9554|nr:GNAT family N-acetyltransferase [Roseovarius nanhaiticus]
MTAAQTNVVLRELDGVAELKGAEEFQRTVWGADDPADNSDLMLAIQHEGGLVAGAFVEGRMLGFLFGFPTTDSKVQHSHRLAVHPDSRGLGLGARLKWYQRDWCLARGITSVRWTFDPLRRINANLNIARLGATANVYLPDYYGKMEGINAGVASDRIVADWALLGKRVTRLADGTSTETESNRAAVRIAIPRDFDAILSDDLDHAISERQRVREEMVAAFAGGYRITNFDAAASVYGLSIP